MVAGTTAGADQQQELDRVNGLGSAAARLAVVLVLLLGSACSDDGDAGVARVGGARGVAPLGDIVVTAAAGGTLTVEHAGTPPEDDEEAPVTHAFVGGVTSALPPLFSPAQGGLIPNPGVWGQCRGGEVSAAVAGCPIPPAEGPVAWDGATYWSLGALLPGERRELPLAETLPDGAMLVCAIHPELRLVLRPEGEVASEEAAEERVAAALSAAPTQPYVQGRVAAGIMVDGAYVGRFSPAKTTVAVGSTVRWEAGARAPIDVVFNGGDLDLTHTGPQDATPAGDASGWRGKGELRSGFLSADESAGAAAASWSVTFLRPGRYTYASRFGEDLRGTIVVRDR